MVRADTVNALAAGMDVRTAGRRAELIARRYMMMIMGGSLGVLVVVLRRLRLMDVFEGLLNWWCECL